MGRSKLVFHAGNSRGGVLCVCDVGGCFSMYLWRYALPWAEALVQETMNLVQLLLNTYSLNAQRVKENYSDVTAR